MKVVNLSCGVHAPLTFTEVVPTPDSGCIIHLHKEYLTVRPRLPYYVKSYTIVNDYCSHSNEILKGDLLHLVHMLLAS